MGRFDDRDEELNNRSKPVSNLLTMFLFGIALGFIGGAVWGFFYFESLQMNEAFAFEWAETKNYNTYPKDTMSFGDSITVRLLNGHP